MEERSKIAIMLLNTDPDRPASLGAPFFQAIVAASLDLEVSIYFAARNVALLRQGVAEAIHPGRDKEKSVYSFMQDAHEAGVRFYACGGALGEHGVTTDNRIPELDDVAGGATFISEIIEPETVTLTY